MKKIKNYENYLIDEDGNVFNSNTNKYLDGSIGENGYKYYRLSQNGQKKMFYAHRLVAETFIDNPNSLNIVNHIDHNKLNNNVNNLEWVNYSENTKAWHDHRIKKTNSPIEYYKEDLEGEKWIQYKNYDVSSCGRIKHHFKNNILKPSVTCGYYKVRLSENGLTEDFMIHKLVYKLFGSEELDDKKVIDHIDGNKLNNNINNLRQVSNSENAFFALYTQHTNSSAKKVKQFDLEGNFIAEFVSTKHAAKELNLDSSTISKVCRGKNKTHGGFIFKYS